jgi:hypothetical protein
MTGNAEGGFGNLVWVRDKDGKEYACDADALKGNIKCHYQGKLAD